MDHFVVGQWQRKVFRKGIDQAERQFAVMELAVNRIVMEVTQGVVHPSHVPLQRESQPTFADGA